MVNVLEYQKRADNSYVDCVTLESSDPVRGGDYYLEFQATTGGIEWTIQRFGLNGLEPAYTAPSDIVKAAKRLCKELMRDIVKAPLHNGEYCKTFVMYGNCPPWPHG